MNLLNPKLIKATAENLVFGKGDGSMLWFMVQIFEMIIFVMGAIMLLWLYAPFSLLAKVIITTLSGMIVFDVFKNFVYTKWMLLKESED